MTLPLPFSFLVMRTSEKLLEVATMLQKGGRASHGLCHQLPKQQH